MLSLAQLKSPFFDTGVKGQKVSPIISHQDKKSIQQKHGKAYNSNLKNKDNTECNQRNIIDSCNLDVILETIALNGLDKVQYILKANNQCILKN